MRHLTALFLGNNQLQVIPSGISQLCNLTLLDLSHNKIRNLPKEIGDMVSVPLLAYYLFSDRLPKPYF